MKWYFQKIVFQKFLPSFRKIAFLIGGWSIVCMSQERINVLYKKDIMTEKITFKKLESNFRKDSYFCFIIDSKRIVGTPCESA